MFRSSVMSRVLLFLWTLYKLGGIGWVAPVKGCGQTDSPMLHSFANTTCLRSTRIVQQTLRDVL